MFGFGPVEIGVIVLLAVLLFGNRFPKIARSVGSSVVEFKNGLRGVAADVDGARTAVNTALRETECSLVAQTNELRAAARSVVGDKA